MAKPKIQTIVLNETTMKLVAALSTITAAHVMVQLFNRGVFTDADLEMVYAGLEGSSLGDPSLNAMARSMAETLRSQMIDFRMN